MTSYRLSHLEELEAESIYILREAAASSDRPVMLYSIGKDSSVLLHLAQKAFSPGVAPFPLLHIDTTVKFPEMYAFREKVSQRIKMPLHVHVNQAALATMGPAAGWNCATCSKLLKTQGLRTALSEGGYDVAIGGARRDEERSRAKERVFSFRNHMMQWDPRSQRPELWDLYNTSHQAGESFRVFPLSNWTELDIWQYILFEDIEVVPLYFAARRRVVRRDGLLLMVGDRIQPNEGEPVETLMCRFRTLGCQLCTGAIPSRATTVTKIIEEIVMTRRSERECRAVDRDRAGGMERKKREGYF